MTTVKLPHIQAFKDRHGKWRYYFRRPGQKLVPLRGDPGSAQFLADYQRALNEPPPSIGGGRYHPQSLHSLIALYLIGGEFGALKQSSQRTFRNQLDRFRGQYGARSALTIQTKHLDAIFFKMKPHAAANLRKRLRRVFSLAVRLGWRSDNPVRDTDLGNFTRGEIAPWSEEDIARFESRWPSGSRERLAFALLLYTGQRRSDVVKMGRQHIQDGQITVAQVKTGHRLRIPVLPELQREIANQSGMAFLTGPTGKPLSVDGFGNWFREAVRAAGIEGKSPHGLRKAAGRRLAEAGCTEKEIGAILGHRTLGEVARYTRDADQARLSRSAVEKLIANKV